MTLAKSVVTGTVFRNPENRSTRNNITVYQMILNIGDKEETLIRVTSTRTSLEPVMESIVKGEKVLVEGRLQTANAKMDDGTERKIFEIIANTIEKIGSSSITNNTPSNSNISKFAEEEFSEELLGAEEIPF